MKIDSWFLHDYDMAVKQTRSRWWLPQYLTADMLFDLEDIKAEKAAALSTQEVWDEIDATYTLYEHVDEPICSHLIDEITEILNDYAWSHATITRVS